MTVVKFLAFDPAFPEHSSLEPVIQWIEYLGELYPLKSKHAHDLVSKKIAELGRNQSDENPKDRNVVAELNSLLLTDVDFGDRLVGILFRERGNPPRIQPECTSSNFNISSASIRWTTKTDGKLDEILDQIEQLRREVGSRR